MSRSRNWHTFFILVVTGGLFTPAPVAAQTPGDPTEIGRAPKSSHFAPEIWQGAAPSKPANSNSFSRLKDACPLCGARHAQDPLETVDDPNFESADAIEPKALARYLKELLTRNVSDERPTTKKKLKTKEKLRPGEPAQVILELKERLGGSALEGSEFADSPDMLVKLIRALEAEQQQEPDQREVETTTAAPQPKYLPAADETSINALRQASRELDLAADVLEEQNLFERADQLRVMADELRRDSRAAVVRPQADGRHGAPQATQLPRNVPQVDAEIGLSADIEQLRDELRRMRQALETRLNQPRQ